jgi:hypothetical protein
MTYKLEQGSSNYLISNRSLKFIFMMQNMKSSNPDLPTTEIAKKLGEMWQKMSSIF